MKLYSILTVILHLIVHYKLHHIIHAYLLGTNYNSIKLFSTRVNYPVPVHHASTRPLGTKKLSVLNLEMLDTSMMA